MKKILGLALAIIFNFQFSILNCQPTQDPLASHIDRSVRPQDDFWRYANGAWFASHPIPESEVSNGIFDLVADTVAAQVKRICEQAAATTPPQGTSKQKVGDLYALYLDSVGRNARGLSEIQTDLERIAQIDDLDALIREVAYQHSIGAAALFGFYVSADDKNSRWNAAFLSQGGLTLPERAFYFDTDEHSQKSRAAFKNYVAALFRLLGRSESEAQAKADAVVELETDMASFSRKIEELRDPEANYNKMSFADFRQLAPSVNLEVYLRALHASIPDSVVVGQPEFFRALDERLFHRPLELWKDYLTVHFLAAVGSDLDDTLFNIDFDFFNRALYGRPEPQPRWKRAVSSANSLLGDEVGRIYVDEILPAGTKEKFREIAEAIRAEYAVRIGQLDWMEEDTKAKALDKLAAVRMKLAYPDVWKDTRSLSVVRTSYYRNAINIRRWHHAYMMRKIGQPVDLEEWHMYPQTYNAYYSPSENAICIPGCNILVPGFEGRMPDDAVLYAIIGGSTIGHELTHGFDDQGSLYDKNGNLGEWWTKGDRERFTARTKQIVAQFSAYEGAGGIHVNGDATQGENIADLGGVVLGLQAFRHSALYKSGERIGGFTPLQRYFLGYACGWMQNYREEALISRLKSDVHSPANWRVNGPLSDIDEFYDAFDVRPGDALYRAPEDRVKIW